MLKRTTSNSVIEQRGSHRDDASQQQLSQQLRSPSSVMRKTALPEPTMILLLFTCALYTANLSIQYADETADENNLALIAQAKNQLGKAQTYVKNHRHLLQQYSGDMLLGPLEGLEIDSSSLST